MTSLCRALRVCLSAKREWFPLYPHAAALLAPSGQSSSGPSSASAPSPANARSGANPADLVEGDSTSLATQSIAKSRKALYEEISHDVLKGVLPLLEILNERSDAYAECCKRATGEDATRKLESLTNPVMHDLLVAVTDLITVYNEEAERGDNRCAADVAKALNQRDREKILFSLLATPSDEVKLAAVRCLYAVPLKELDPTSEVSRLVSMLDRIPDVTAGRMEEVIAVSLEILTKLCLSREFGARFRSSYARDAVEACMKILEKNVSRETRGSVTETEEKAIPVSYTHLTLPTTPYV